LRRGGSAAGSAAPPRSVGRLDRLSAAAGARARSGARRAAAAPAHAGAVSIVVIVLRARAEAGGAQAGDARRTETTENFVAGLYRHFLRG
jgi:hypothetical protein